ncbi:unnamed protein product [Parascedosporium putredinis]|uniref:Uncharacterized protein n=1 Tax=Parascedosporium putredinis TaxID=1442378 RepID=A0A9P1H2W7_9PEZI|nr:unnamed protein product [Parascedosporium putredinis]CAI7993998.1 unnamed protein product [Parascedosporium putredinis]
MPNPAGLPGNIGQDSDLIEPEPSRWTIVDVSESDYTTDDDCSLVEISRGIPLHINFTEANTFRVPEIHINWPTQLPWFQFQDQYFTGNPIQPHLQTFLCPRLAHTKVPFLGRPNSAYLPLTKYLDAFTKAITAHASRLADRSTGASSSGALMLSAAHSQALAHPKSRRAWRKN